MSERPQRGPVLQPGEEPPGAWVDDGKHGGRIWKGIPEWLTHHGAATVQWMHARENYVWNAAFPDGSRAHVAYMWPANDLFRRPIGDTYQYGTIDVRDDDVIFTPTADPELEVQDEFRGLFNVLISDEAFLSDIREIALARALYSAIENAHVTCAGKRYEFGQRSAAHFVAALRRNGETYLDFAWDGNREPANAARIAAHFERLGITYVVDYA